jgi:hypothetical protein
MEHGSNTDGEMMRLISNVVKKRKTDDAANCATRWSPKSKLSCEQDGALPYLHCGRFDYSSCLKVEPQGKCVARQS